MTHRIAFSSFQIPMSSFSWLDYSEHERRRMLEVVDLFKEKDTRDELGLGGIRDAFANLFFPGTSTIMTRARYFLLVPWTYLRMEGKKVGSRLIAERARQAETGLIEPIEASDDSDGNIGRRAGATVKRLPSSVYWQGMWVWGIRTFSGSQDQYHRNLDRFYEQSKRHGGRMMERDTEHDDIAACNWHPSLSQGMGPPEDFPTACTLSLSRKEAEFLRERIRLSPSSAGTLLDELVTRRKRHDLVAFPWQHPNVADLPKGIQEMLHHAQNFSELLHGASLLYNLILAEESKSKELIDDFDSRLEDWAAAFFSRGLAFQEWNQARFWEIAHNGNPRISMGSQEFVNAWWSLVLSSEPAAIKKSRPARALITERERRLKKALARIGNPRAQEIWAGDSGSGAMEFRWITAQRLLNDVFDGLEADHVKT